jgi:hypothetical protein
MRTVWPGDDGFERFIGNLVDLGAVVLGNSVTMNEVDVDE